jgi:hypothetical protein
MDRTPSQTCSTVGPLSDHRALQRIDPTASGRPATGSKSVASISAPTAVFRLTIPERWRFAM